MDSLFQWLATSMAPLLALVFLYHLWSSPKSKNNNESRKVPEAAGAWPIIGHLHQLFGRELPFRALGTMADKYGPIFYLRLGLHRELVISNWEIVKECFTTNDRFSSDRPAPIAFKHITHGDKSIGFAPYGPYWHKLRKIAMVNLLSNNRLDMLKHVRASEIDACFGELYRMWKNGGDQRPVLVDMKKWFGDMTLSVMTRMVVGKRLFGFKASQGDKEAKQYREAVEKAIHLMELVVVSDVIPFLGWMDHLQGNVGAMKRTAKELDTILERWLEEHRLAGDAGEKCFIDATSSIMEDTQLYGNDPKVVLKSTSLALILGGRDTTTVPLTWAVSLLMNNRHALKKAQEELDKHVGKERQVDDSDIPNLVYLQAIIKETLRIYPTGPLLERQTTEDGVVGGYHIPAGTRLLVNIWKVQQDPRVWSNPDEFQPERFLTTNVGTDVRGQNFELIPFGTGRRVCPGVSFALQLMNLALARFLHGFELATHMDEKIDMTESPGQINHKATPLPVLIAPRLPSKLYG